MSTLHRRLLRKVWPELAVKPVVRDGFGHPERRRAMYATVEQLKSLRARMVAGLLIVALVASIAAKLGYDAGRNNDLRVCMSGGELRILLAQSNDLLRRSAVGLVPGQNANPRVQRFLRNTQPAVDAFLSQAAGKPYHVQPPGGEVTDATVSQVNRLSMQRCHKRVNGKPTTTPR